MKSLILSRHPPPSSSEDNEKYVEICRWRIFYLTHGYSSRRGWQWGWRSDRWEHPRRRDSTLPDQRCAWKREDSILLIWQFRNVWQQILTDIIELPHLNIWMGLSLWVLVYHKSILHCVEKETKIRHRSKLKCYWDLLWRSDTDKENNAVEKNGENTAENQDEEENCLSGKNLGGH